ncbi:M61 family metallopeptidase [Flocculibacter collagenilyticus]|uniref:M61 family metallopeptidase n=1 Tax=Flocculibacter collagenilyticus TaxID=2744479 RepID=UPI0018F639D5|nr:hypothetical protein [Flocculibacter collagenilyticus]
MSKITHAQSYFELAHPNTRIELYIDEKIPKDNHSTVVQWLSQAIETTASLYGEFPLSITQVNVSAANRGDGPVPWAQVIRHHPEGVRFYIQPQATLSELNNDWTAVHEFSHLYIPFPGDNDIWFSEGLASYLQYLLMAKNDIISEQTAWQRLYEGFQRGQAASAYTQQTLSSSSKRMHKLGSYMRVYWSGAVYFLNVDVKLMTGNYKLKSVAEVLQKFNQCCRHHPNSWTGEQLAKTFDQLAGDSVFYPTFKAVTKLTQFPDFNESFSALGISIRNGKVVLSNDKHKRAKRLQLVRKVSKEQNMTGKAL